MSTGPWLVTGASGFLGRHFLTQLEADQSGHRAVALLRHPVEWRRMDWTEGLTRTGMLEGELLEPAAWSGDERLSGLGGVLHLAALVRHCRRDAEAMYRANVEGTAAMVRLASRYRCRMVLVSTSGTVGCFRSADATAAEDAPFCEDTVRGWPYYDSKIQAERGARRLADDLGVELVILRPPILLGPGDHRYRSTNHITRFLRGKLPFLIRGGIHFADVRDVAAAIRRLIALERPKPVYHFPGTAQTVEAFFAEVARIAGRKPPGRVLPYGVAHFLARVTAPLRILPDPVVIEMARHYWGLSSRYAGELGYVSRPGTDTLADTIGWLQQHHPALQSN